MSATIFRHSLLSATAVALFLTAASAPALNTVNASETPRCTLTPQGTHTIVTFGSRLFANRGADQAVGPTRPVTLAPGAYRVTLVSYDNHAEKTLNQRHEKWHIELNDSSGSRIAATSAISDLPEDRDVLTEIVDQQLNVPRPVTFATPRHAFFPAKGAESVTAVCAGFERLGSPSTSPLPSPTRTPASTPSATPAPEPEEDDKDEPDFALTIKKTDHRSTTRPGHSLTYEIKVRNSGSGTVEDVIVTDALPGAVTANQISDSGTLDGHIVTWPEFALSPDEEKTFFVTTTVKPGTSSGHTLTNNVKARSKDKGISVNDLDTTVVEAARQSGGQARAPRVKAAATTVPTPPPAAAVPITAKTGAATQPLAALAALLGSSSLAYTLRRHR